MRTQTYYRYIILSESFSPLFDSISLTIFDSCSHEQLWAKDILELNSAGAYVSPAMVARPHRWRDWQRLSRQRLAQPQLTSLTCTHTRRQA